MQCAYPMTINYNTVPCGQCMQCRLTYAKNWALRIMLENAIHDKAVFITLTYAPEHMPEDGSIHKKEVQNFLKRLRKRLPPKTLRYFASGEYGDETFRPHYHAILFGINPDENKLIEQAWPKGFVHCGTVTSDSASYCAKYIIKKIKGKKAKEHYANLGHEPEFALMSRNPGLGLKTIINRKEELKSRGYIMSKGIKYPLDRYTLSKIFTEEELSSRSFELSELYLEEDEEWNKINKNLDKWEKRYLKYQQGLQMEKNVKAKLSLTTERKL